jgi:predicted enzyme related to lactoylglutathione lyase
VLNQAQVTANIPASDLERARRFYAQKLGLEPDSEYPGMLVYRTGSGTPFMVYQTEHAGIAQHTIAQWHVQDVDAEVRALQGNGVSFEVYDGMPGVEWHDVVAVIAGMGKAAWFKDSEGNILCIDDAPV